MQNVTTEQVAGLITGATPVQIVTLILLGATVFGLVMFIMVNLIRLYTAPLIKEIEQANADRAVLNDIRIQLAEISKSLWSKADIQEKIQSAVTRHELDCPFRTQKGK